ncbi:hypothetical protein ACTXKF_17315 [Vreelandella alkaliphila]|uniref:hypothetical protein n=1 Tax=Vreelandella alkaliphila TaxID=272774 RepID=UPI003FD7C61F
MVNTLTPKSATRNVRLSGGKIFLESSEVPGFQYACYLISNESTLKFFYQDEPDFCFKKEADKGFYSGCFYYKDKVSGEKEVHRLDFLVNSGGTIEIPSCVTLSESENFKVDYYDVGGDVTFFVFNGVGSTKNNIPFGLGYLLKKGFNVVACYQDNHTQYQYLSRELLYNAVEGIICNKKVFTYGASLGGYCAIYYAGVLGATAIAAAPRNSAHPLILKDKKSRFWGLEFKHEKTLPPISKDKEVYVFLDPYHLSDVFFYRRYVQAACPAANLIEVPHAGHEVLYYLNETKQLSGVIESIVQGTHPSVNCCLPGFYKDLGLAVHWVNVGDPIKAEEYLCSALGYKELAAKSNKKVELVKDRVNKLKDKFIEF